MTDTNNKTLGREIVTIFTISIFLALIYNALSSKGIPLIRKEINKVTVPDSLLFSSIAKSDSINFGDAVDTILPKGFKVIAPLHERALKNPDSVAQLFPNHHEPVWKIISLEQLDRLMRDRRGILLDARGEEEFKKGHIKGARNIPGLEPEKYVEQIIEQPRDTLIIIYCNNPDCHLGKMLADFLSIMGFKNLYIYDDGWDGWMEAHMPVDISQLKNN